MKTEYNNLKPDKNLYVLKFVGYLIWGLQRTELWAVVVALYGFCQGGENKRYVLSIAPTTVYIYGTLFPFWKRWKDMQMEPFIMLASSTLSMGQ